MRRVLKTALIVLVSVVLIAVGVVGYLWATSARPRVSAEWTRLANFPAPRGEVATAVGARVDDPCEREPCPASPVRMLVAGGIAGAGKVSTRVDAYDPTGDVWTRAPDLPEPRHHAAAASIGGVTYVGGGALKATAWDPVRTVWRLDPSAPSWEPAPSMPEGRLGHQMVAVGTKLYVVGGRGPTSNVLIFDSVSQQWSLGAPMPEQRDHLLAVADGTRILAIGGRASGLLARVDVYDTTSDRWSSGTPLPEPMSAMAGGLLSDGIHVVGGEDPNTVSGGIIDRHYVLRDGRWQSAPLPIVATHGAGGAVVTGRLIVAGGSRRQGSLSPLGWTGIVQAYEPTSE